MSYRIIKSTPMGDTGKTRMIIEVAKGCTLLAIHPDGHYQMPDPVGEVLGGHILQGAVAVHWCSATQEWV